MRQYLDLMHHVIDHGTDRPDQIVADPRGELLGEVKRIGIAQG